MKDINLCSTNELLEELFSRFEHCIFAALKIRDNETKITKRKYKGNLDTCISLAYKIQQFIFADWRINEQNISDNFED